MASSRSRSGRIGHLDAARPIVADLVGDAAADARAAGLDAMAQLDGPLDLGAIGPLRLDPTPAVRAAALRASATHATDGVAIFLEAFDDPSSEVRSAAAVAVCHRPGGVAAALVILDDGSSIEQETALEALIGHEEAARSGLIAWADREVVRAASLRRGSLVLARTSPTSVAAYLGDVLGRRADAIVARLLTALALLGAPEASGLIRRCLHSIDPEVRAQAIEALDSIGDARLARGVVRLLDSDASALAADAPGARRRRRRAPGRPGRLGARPRAPYTLGRAARRAACDRGARPRGRGRGRPGGVRHRGGRGRPRWAGRSGS